ncbi:RecX family transcriptional regulator [Candidatus Saccharibacteria bacterium]|nr:RecX family transcriptional regulator [Candidatus Saccharibacteria bacterium]
MKISDIKQQVKRQDRYSIYIDGKYSFSLSENELMHRGLKIDQEFNKESFEEIKQTAVEDKAYMQAVELIARRKRSQWEMQQYLKRKGYSNNTTAKILNKLSINKLLDDKDFARAWVENRRLLKHTSKRKLWQELKQKRVADSLITEVLDSDETDEQKVLAEIIEKKITQTRYKNKEKLMAYLVRQGFSYSDVKDVLADKY